MSTVAMIVAMEVLAASTQHEALALAHRKARDRAEGRTIGRGARISAFQQMMIFWPTFAFAGLAAPPRSIADRAALQPILDACDDLYDTEVFRAFAACVKPQLRRGWTFQSVLAGVGGQAPDVLIGLHVEIKRCERDLRASGLLVESHAAQVVRIAADGLIIAGAHEPPRLLTPVNFRRLQVLPDMWVVRERVSVLGYSGELVVPAVAPAALPELPAVENSDAQPDGQAPAQTMLTTHARPANTLAAHLLGEFAAERVDADWAMMWSRGEGRSYPDADDPLAGTVEDRDLALSHRRSGRGAW